MVVQECLESVGVKKGMAAYFSCVIDPEGGDMDLLHKVMQTASLFLHGTEEARADIIFQSMDYDGNGVLDREELCRTIKLMSWATNGGSVHVHINVWGLADAILERADEDGDGVLDKQEFLKHHTFITDALTQINSGVGSTF